tara:strand:+ start:116 stop:841 length:726 start_codon:yes stop_codon:yes gene_type:complete
MADISSYPKATPTASDLLLGTSISSLSLNKTRNFSVADIAAFGSGTDSNSLMLNNVKIRPEWSNKISGQFVTSTLFTNLKYPLLKVNFENLQLNVGSTYKLIIERFKRPSSRIDTADVRQYRNAGYKRQKPFDSVAPYNGRVIEIPITATSGQLFDFKLDLYYSCRQSVVLNDIQFPKIAGFKHVPTSGSIVKSKQYVAFRISQTTNGVTKTSPVLQELTMLGTEDSDGTATQRRITFIPR